MDKDKTLILTDTHGKTIQNTERTEEKLTFHFSDGTSFTINLTDPKLKKADGEGKFTPQSECKVLK